MAATSFAVRSGDPASGSARCGSGARRERLTCVRVAGAGSASASRSPLPCGSRRRSFRSSIQSPCSRAMPLGDGGAEPREHRKRGAEMNRRCDPWGPDGGHFSTGGERQTLTTPDAACVSRAAGPAAFRSSNTTSSGVATGARSGSLLGRIALALRGTAARARGPDKRGAFGERPRRIRGCTPRGQLRALREPETLALLARLPVRQRLSPWREPAALRGTLRHRPTSIHGERRRNRACDGLARSGPGG